jgi:hypothetical protein
MTIDKATESGWRPVTKQDLIDLIDGGEPQAARFRDNQHQEWHEGTLMGFRLSDGERCYVKSTGFVWKQCEIKTQVLRDPKFSDLENGPIECMVYENDNPNSPHSPLKAFLVGMQHRSNPNNTTGMAYHVRYLHDKSTDGPRFRWHVKIVDTEVEAVKTETDELPKQVEPTDDGWRSPTVEDLKNGPIECEVRDTLDAVWEKRTLESIASLNYYPYRTISLDWRYCRIRK